MTIKDIGSETTVDWSIVSDFVGTADYNKIDVALMYPKFFDPSQAMAVKHALSNRVALIQVSFIVVLINM